MSTGLYIHIPFCIKKCNYCDFLSFPSSSDTISRYCRALKEEISQTAAPSIRTIFIGGGTPSILTPDQVMVLFSSIRDHFPVEDSAEISLEANPGTICPEKLEAWREAGVNRLSMGLQSTDEDMLKRLGRIHSFRQFAENYELARKAGFENINIDLISALPGQTLSSWIRTLETVLSFKPDHISAYSLIIEEGTPFFEDNSVLDSLPDEDTDRQMYEYTRDILSAHGYHRYEISNYALEGKECRHNMGYWDGSPYLGLGLGASSFYGHARFSNEKKLEKYLKTPFIPFDQRDDYERQTKEQEMEDRMIFGLRMMKGVSRQEFEADFGVSLDDVYGNVIKKHQQYGLLEEVDGRIRLTGRGIDVSNRIFEGFIK